MSWTFDYTPWSPWFAWYPVHVRRYGITWLRRVERRTQFCYYVHDGWRYLMNERYQYREI